MPDQLGFGERRVGDGGKEPLGRSRRLRIPGQADRLVGAQRANADPEGRSPGDRLGGDLVRPPPLVAGQVGGGAGAAEQADPIDPRRRQRLQQSAQGGGIDAIGKAERPVILCMWAA